MNRRNSLCMLFAVAASAAASPTASRAYFAHPDLTNQELADWKRWKSAFLTDDGRVVDHLQDDASHSEGQGYGMLLATWFGDEAGFRRMHDWTSRYLAVRADPLLAWRWKPNQRPQISDYNNATDGDLFYAWALLRAAVQFNTPDYLAKAQEIARFLAASCVRADPRGSGRLLLLPGAEGFAAGNDVIVNPSYYMPEAMRELGLATGTPQLIKCADDGEALLADLAATGPVPDWIEVGPSGFRPAPDHVAQSGYDALRSALFLIWSGRVDHPAVWRAGELYRTMTDPDTPMPTIFDLTGRTVLATSDLQGYKAVAMLVLCAVGADQHQPIPKFSSAQPYYPATLHLFSQIAARRAKLIC